MLQHAGNLKCLSSYYVVSIKRYFFSLSLLYCVYGGTRMQGQYPQSARQTDRQRSWAIGNDPPLYAHMPLPVLRSHNPGCRPRTPG